MQGLNIEKERIERGANGFSGEGDLRLAFRQGNTNLLDLGSRARLTFRRNRHTVFALADLRFAAKTLARDGGQTSGLADRDARYLQRYIGHLRHTIRLSQSWAVEAFVQAESDEFALLRLRTLLGGGPRWTLIDSPRMFATLGTSYMLEREALDSSYFVDQPSGDRATTIWHRSSSYLNLTYKVDERLEVRATTYVQLRFDDPSDWRLLQDFSLSLPIRAWLALKIALGVRFDSAPPRYCTTKIEAGSCSRQDIRRLLRADTLFEHSLTFNF
jgi:hypothetical protein